MLNEKCLISSTRHRRLRSLSWRISRSTLLRQAQALIGETLFLTPQKQDQSLILLSIIRFDHAAWWGEMSRVVKPKVLGSLGKTGWTRPDMKTLSLGFCRRVDLDARYAGISLLSKTTLLLTVRYFAGFLPGWFIFKLYRLQELTTLCLIGRRRAFKLPKVLGRLTLHDATLLWSV